jgi:hypothetical protein
VPARFVSNTPLSRPSPTAQLLSHICFDRTRRGRGAMHDVPSDDLKCKACLQAHMLHAHNGIHAIKAVDIHICSTLDVFEPRRTRTCGSGARCCQGLDFFARKGRVYRRVPDTLTLSQPRPHIVLSSRAPQARRAPVCADGGFERRSSSTRPRGSSQAGDFAPLSPAARLRKARRNPLSMRRPCHAAWIVWKAGVAARVKISHLSHWPDLGSKKFDFRPRSPESKQVT